MTKVVNYISDAYHELKSHVSWTPWAEVQRYTIVVTIFTVVLSLATWGVDTVFAEALAGFFNLLNG